MIINAIKSGNNINNQGSSSTGSILSLANDHVRSSNPRDENVVNNNNNNNNNKQSFRGYHDDDYGLLQDIVPSMFLKQEP